MLNKVLNDEKFALLMKMHIYECIEYLLENGINFSVIANLSLVEFKPELPQHIKDSFKMPAIVFMLAGYTFESAELSQEKLTFEAGFGSENFASLVAIPLAGVLQIAIEENPILINFSIPKTNNIQNSKIEKSLSIFKSNPNNKKIIKKDC